MCVSDEDSEYVRVELTVAGDQSDGAVMRRAVRLPVGGRGACFDGRCRFGGGHMSTGSDDQSHDCHDDLK